MRKGSILKTACLAVAMALSWPGTVYAQPEAPAGSGAGWTYRGLGAGKGVWDISVGVFLGNDELKLRNLQLRGDIDLAPALRYHAVVRSNRKMDTLGGLNPYFDENYLETQAFYEKRNGVLSADLRVGTVRYLHFPYPDNIDVFDQVPGIADLKGQSKTGYSGGIAAVDYAHKSGFGLHAAGIRWGFGRSGGSQLLDNYIYYRQNIGQVRLETHFGGLAVRPEPPGRRETGYNVFLGSRLQGYTAGLLYEKLNHQPAYTGVMVTFPMNAATKAMGRVALDYDRSPEGFAMQIPLLAGKIGQIQKKAPPGGILVGEIKAERMRTYWQNGQVRNYYEHRVSCWGETAKAELAVVMVEEPWYLQAEALVSPHLFSDGIKNWERDRQGPAQLSQKVTYKFYRVQ